MRPDLILVPPRMGQMKSDRRGPYWEVCRVCSGQWLLTMLDGQQWLIEVNNG